MRFLLILFTVAICSACTVVDQSAATQKTESNKAAAIPENYKTCIQELAKNADDTVVDGWFFGQEPRMLKSFYRKIPAEQKAEFAIAYHDWMSNSGEDLIQDFKTYVPYSKRANFAFDWWAKKVERFTKQEKKQQVLWAHESIQDAGELWWRANEKLNAAAVDSPQTLAHDEEQRMVSKFMENENSPGSISDQVWKRTH